MPTAKKKGYSACDLRDVSDNPEWTKEDFAHFKASSAQLIKQFDAYKPFPDLHVNGKLTSSENIADVAGLSAAYDAYRMSLGGREAPTVAGLSGDQQFFISFAQAWRYQYREPALRRFPDFVPLYVNGALDPLKDPLNNPPPKVPKDSTKAVAAYYDAVKQEIPQRDSITAALSEVIKKEAGPLPG